MRVLLRVACASWLMAAACTSDIASGGGGGGGSGGGGGGGGGGGEVDAGSGPVTPPPPAALSADDLLKQWSGCMSLANFTTAKMNTAWGDLAAGNGQACSSCHTSGLYGFYVDRDANTMFNAISTTKAFLAVYFSADVTNQTIGTDDALFATVGAGTGSFAGHPPFTTNSNAGLLALKSFHDLTLARQQANTCDPPRLTQ
jgi:hypothetical protein